MAQLELPWTDTLDVAVQFSKAKASARTIADMAQGLATELGDAPGAELRIWAQALISCIESNLRDAQIAIPLLSLSSKDLVAFEKAMTRESARSSPQMWTMSKRLCA